MESSSYPRFLKIHIQFDNKQQIHIYNTVEPEIYDHPCCQAKVVVNDR